MSIPFVKQFDFTYGEGAQLSPLVRRVICNNPGPFTFSGSGTYLVGTDEIAVIDPGPANDAHLAALLRAADGGRISHIFVTHTHKDHCGGVAALNAATGAEVVGAAPHPAETGGAAPALDEGADRSYRPDRPLAHGETIATADWALEAIATPGHISNHLCFALAAEQALFTGDHIMGWATTVVTPPNGDMSAYIDSLDKLLTREDEIYFPTHGAPIQNPKRFVRAVKTHRLMRDAQIIEQLKKGRDNIKDITAVLYADVDKRLLGAAALNVLAHLIRLVRNGAVVCDGKPAIKTAFRLADPS